MTPEGTTNLGTGPHSNLKYNTGHGHLGWTMLSGTARITADLIGGKKPEIPVKRLEYVNVYLPNKRRTTQDRNAYGFIGFTTLQL